MSTIVRDLWPADLVAEVVLGPQDILEYQATLLGRRMNGLLQAKVVRTDARDRIILSFEVFAPKIDMTKLLFTVHHQSESEYPVTIDPPYDHTPNYLKRRYTEDPDSHNYPDDGEPNGPYEVENEWVADSPMEFTDKLALVLSSAVVKSTLFSLLAKSQRSPVKANPPDDQT